MARSNVISRFQVVLPQVATRPRSAALLQPRRTRPGSAGDDARIRPRRSHFGQASLQPPLFRRLYGRAAGAYWPRERLLPLRGIVRLRFFLRKIIMFPLWGGFPGYSRTSVCILSIDSSTVMRRCKLVTADASIPSLAARRQPPCH